MKPLVRLAPAMLLALAVAAPAQADSTLTITNAAVAGGKVLVSGTLSLGAEATAAVTVAQDGAGDASAPGLGLDLGDATIKPDLVAKRLTFSVAIRDGIAALDSSSPFTGFYWPITADGEDKSMFLGAGAVGSNFTPATAKWVSLCYFEGGWGCPINNVTGSVTATAVTWTVPFTKTVQGYEWKVTPGSVVDPGGVYGSYIASHVWPSVVVTAPTAPADTSSVSSYQIPGGISIGIVDQGTPPEEVEYTATGTFSVSTGAFSGSITPNGPGAYTLFVKSCYGLTDAPTCLTAQRDITV